MKVIVAGMSKTGTKSINQALTILGYEVYDFVENLFLLADDFTKVVNEGWTTEDFRRMYQDVDATVDFPAYFFWEEIHKAFPEAKIVLTIRDEEAWVESMVNQLEQNESSLLLRSIEVLSPTNRKTSQFLKKMTPMALGLHPGSVFRRKYHINREMLKKMYRQHNAYVQHAAPKDKLLVFNCSEGWEPLCDFLNVPVPWQPFPHKNKGAELVKEMANFPVYKKMRREVMVSATLLLTGTIVTGLAIYKYGLTNILERVYSRA